jgi:hypothetical protein
MNKGDVVICVNNNYTCVGQWYKYHFTIGKQYIILSEKNDGSYVGVRDDRGDVDLYDKRIFQLLSDYREEKLKKLLTYE